MIGRGGRFGTAVSPDNKDAVLVEYGRHPTHRAAHHRSWGPAHGSAGAGAGGRAASPVGPGQLPASWQQQLRTTRGERARSMNGLPQSSPEATDKRRCLG